MHGIDFNQITAQILQMILELECNHAHISAGAPAKNEHLSFCFYISV